MLLAETVTFDPGDVVLIVVAFLLFLLAVGGLAVAGVWSGWIAGRGTNRTASVLWGTCVAIEALLVVQALRAVSLQVALVLAAPLGAAVFARYAPRT